MGNITLGTERPQILENLRSMNERNGINSQGHDGTPIQGLSVEKLKQINT